MGMQETAQDVLGLVQALAQGKTLEYRGKGGNVWSDYGPSDGELLFYLAEFDYRIKTDPLEAWRKELLEHVIKYGEQAAKAMECYVRNNQRDGAKHDVQADEALNAFKSKLAFGPKGFK